MDQYDYNWMMYRQMQLRAMHRDFSTQGWALLIYCGIMNVLVMAVMVLDTVAAEFSVSGQVQDNSGWGYLAAIGVGAVILLLWKKPKFFSGTVFRRGRPMKAGSFLALLVLCLSAQLVSQIVMILLELVLNQFGLSLMEYLLSAESGDTLAMFLYMSLGAPVSEEILFRGLVMRSMEPYGKKFAIFASALLFGLFHGNLIQIPFAFVIGLVLGYVATEYSVVWAMVLHMFNNLIFADTLPRLLGAHIPQWENMLTWAMILGSALAALVILLVKRKTIGAYLRCERTDPLCRKAFFTAPGIIVLMVVMALLTVMTLAVMVTA